MQQGLESRTKQNEDLVTNCKLVNQINLGQILSETVVGRHRQASQTSKLKESWELQKKYKNNLEEIDRLENKHFYSPEISNFKVNPSKSIEDNTKGMWMSGLKSRNPENSKNIVQR